MKVAFQGERGAFSEAAAFKILGNDISPIPCHDFKTMFTMVETGKAKFAVVPIENSLAGSVHANFDLLIKHTLSIVGETHLRIEHHLIGNPGSTLKKIKKVYSHPVALAQCIHFLDLHPEIEVISFYDTAGSVKEIRTSGKVSEAAIAGASAAKIYKGKILARSIEDHKNNYTRFLLVSNSKNGKNVKLKGSGKSKTSIIFNLKNQSGALFKALGVFASRDIDLTKIESRPIQGRPWEYSFYVDILGQVGAAPVDKALKNLEECADNVRVLGSYIAV